jgi:basic amino acid/polyamine antiporter, APA family
MPENTALKRSLSLPMMVLYGLGTTVGAGIYALVGELAAVAGYLAPASFLLASIMAIFIGMAFAELSARFPRAAGEAVYVENGFSSTSLATVIGLAVAFAGVVSAAALVNGFVGYFHEFIVVDRVLIIIVITSVLFVIAVWGIAESVTIAALITLIEIGGLILVIIVSRDAFTQLPEQWPQFIPSLSTADGGVLFAGAILAFYAFIGFEDMVNVAEEVKNVRRNLPLAILLTLGITTVLYLVVMTVTVLGLPMEILVKSEAPLALLYEHYTGKNAVLIGVIGLFAIINGALIQIIMASRVLYGLSSNNQLPSFLSRVNQRTRTPVYATLIASIIVMILALLGSLATLAEATSLILLTVFSIVSLALWRIKSRDPSPEGIIVFPAWVSLIAFMASSAFVLIKGIQFISHII